MKKIILLFIISITTCALRAQAVIDTVTNAYGTKKAVLDASSTFSATTTNALTVNNSGSGASSGTTFNGSSAVTISYNSIGAAPASGSSSITTVGTLTAGSIPYSLITGAPASSAPQYYKEPSSGPSTAPVSSGTSTVVIGDGAKGYSNYEVIYGYQAGNTDASSNNFIAIGSQAGNSSTGMSGAIAIGVGISNQSNNPNSIYIGNGTGQYANNNTGGTIAIGSGAGVAGSQNGVISMGTNAGYYANYAAQSFFMGYQSGNNMYGPSNTGVTAVVCLGYQAGQMTTGAISTCSNSNFIGYGAGANAYYASNANFMGNGAGGSAASASNSNFYGNSAGQGATNASNSNFFGVNAGYGATNASNSNFLGANAGYGATNASNSNFFGEYVGKAFSGNNIGANNIIIGTNITLGNGASNGINIGGLIFGTGTYSTTSGNPSYAAQTSGQVAIGTNTYQSGMSLTLGQGIYATSFVKSGGTSAQYLMADGSVTIGTSGTDGLYLPTYTSVLNCSGSASTIDTAQYSVSGHTVTVSGLITVSPTAAGNCTFEISLPSGYTNIGPAYYRLSGTAVSTGSYQTAAGIYGNLPNGNYAVVNFYAPNNNTQQFSYHFTYRTQ